MIVVFLHFFIEGPDLGNLSSGFAAYTLQYSSLVADDPFKQFNGCALRHGFIPVTSHANGDQAFIRSHPFNTLPPEIPQFFFILFIVPGS